MAVARASGRVQRVADHARLTFLVNAARAFHSKPLIKRADIMKAAVIDAPNAEVRIEERDRPSPGRGEVLIRVRACGVCHGDLMLQLGQFPFARYPIVPGHEVAGVIEEVGDDVSKLQRGERVGLSALFSSCGSCERCLDSDEFLCSELQFTGITQDGGYQQFMLALAAYVARL